MRLSEMDAVHGNEAGRNENKPLTSSIIHAQQKNITEGSCSDSIPNRNANLSTAPKASASAINIPNSGEQLSCIEATNIADSQNAQEGSDEHSTIEIAPKASASSSSRATPTLGRQDSGKLAKAYVLPDGSVSIDGKGLGKGRPGIKRGPRKLLPSEGLSITPSPVQPQAIGIVQPITPNGIKRKRTVSNGSDANMKSALSSISRESTPEYNPTASQTRSGRQTQRPPSIITTPTMQSPAPKRVASVSTITTPNLKSHPKIKRRVYKGKEQLALCEHCLRSYGPHNNVMVFCDACNKCWHQRCHSPQISNAIVADTKAEWFCSSCDKILHGSKKAKKSSTPVSVSKVNNTQLPPPPPPFPLAAAAPPATVQKYGLPLIPPASLSREQRIAYLKTLSKDQLINMVLYASDLAPQMPIYETLLPLSAPPPRQPEPQFASSYVTPVDPVIPEAGSGGGARGAGINNANDVGDEGYDDRFDEYALLYPKVGEGVKLCPDREELHLLLEGPESRTFSHWVRGMNMKTYCDNVSLVVG